MKIVVIADTGSRGGYTQMRHARIFLSVITLSSLLGVTPAGLAQSLTFTSIDPPGASSTYANGVRTAGGTSVPYSAQGAENGVRNQFGEEQHQDASTFPGQGKAQGQDKQHQGTGSTGSTGSTQVVGFYNDAMRLVHSYMVTYLPTGPTFSAINVTGAAYTFATGINGSGQIVGYYFDTGGSHGFVQTSSSTSSFDVPGAVYTFATGISAGGQVTGSYSDNQGTHAFVRTGTGTTATYTTFDAPGAYALYGTNATGVNDTTGQVVGYYYDASFRIHGFLRAGGTFTSLDITGALSTQPNAINSSGLIAGDYFDSGGKLHGFLRSATGSITTIDYPMSSGTTINGLNDSGQLAGEYFDSANQRHGYKTGP